MSDRNDNRMHENCKPPLDPAYVPCCVVKHTVAQEPPSDLAHYLPSPKHFVEDGSGLNHMGDPDPILDSQLTSGEEQGTYDHTPEEILATEIDQLSNLAYYLLNFDNNAEYHFDTNQVDDLTSPHDRNHVISGSQETYHGMVEESRMDPNCPKVHVTLMKKTREDELAITSTSAGRSDFLEASTAQGDIMQTTTGQRRSPPPSATSYKTPPRKQPDREVKSRSKYGGRRESLSPESDTSDSSSLFSESSAASTPMSNGSDSGSKQAKVLSGDLHVAEQESPLRGKTTRVGRLFDPALGPAPGPAPKLDLSLMERKKSHAPLIEPDPCITGSDSKAVPTSGDEQVSLGSSPVKSLSHKRISPKREIPSDRGASPDAHTAQRPQIRHFRSYSESDTISRLKTFERRDLSRPPPVKKDLPFRDRPLGAARNTLKAEIGVDRSTVFHEGFAPYFVESRCAKTSPQPPTRRAGFQFRRPMTKKYASDLISTLGAPVRCRRQGYIYCFSDKFTPDHVKIGSAKIKDGCKRYHSQPAQLGIPENDPHVQERLTEWAEECSLEINLHFAVFMPCAVRKIESLIHITLHKEQRPVEQCVGIQCQKKHREWFYMTPAEALPVVKIWQWFSCLIPYAETGYVEGIWQNYVGHERLRHTRKAPLEWVNEHLEHCMKQHTDQKKRILDELDEKIKLKVTKRDKLLSKQKQTKYTGRQMNSIRTELDSLFKTQKTLASKWQWWESLSERSPSWQKPMFTEEHHYKKS